MSAHPGGPRSLGAAAVLLGATFLAALLWLKRGTSEPTSISAAPITQATTVDTGDASADLAPAIANPILPQPPSTFRFAEIARDAGLDFVHRSGMTPEKHFPTANGSGVALLDYDSDGDLDVYLATATRLPLGSEPIEPGRLFENLGGNRFRDVTEASRAGVRAFTHGVIAGDIDNDGDPDLFFCNYGGNVLLENLGNRTFRDISTSAGVAGHRWSSGGAFLDHDNDGDLDLYVSNYGEWEYPRDAIACTDETFLYAPGEEKVRIYCSPRMIRPARHILYRNNGNKTFTDVTIKAGLGRTDGRGFGVVAADLNADGKIDLYVANDMCPNFLYLNRGDGTFEDASDSSGASLDGHGQALAGMGVDAEDLDGDGLPELFVTNFARQSNTLYANLGQGMFSDASPASGMSADSDPWVGWGCALADLDNDGLPDCLVANGHVDDNLRQVGRNEPYAQPALLHRNIGGLRFQLATRSAGPYFDSRHVGRGLAVGDLDNDGDIDVVINHKDGPPALLRNDTANSHAWIRLNLRGTRSNRDGVGAKVEVIAGDRTIHRQRKGGGSLESSHDPRMLIGLGDVREPVKVIVRWPSGKVRTLERLQMNREHLVSE